MVYERRVSVRTDHPSLAGHFPGHPIVPGVVLLGEVLDTLRHGLAVPLSVTGFPDIKFLVPLKPGEVVTIRVESETTGLATFSCLVDVRLIAAGSIAFRSDTILRAD